MALEGVASLITQMYNEVFSFIPVQHKPLLNAFIFALLIVGYSIFSWKFYRFLSHRDIIGLNLSQYNTLDHPGSKKTLAVLLYMIEYLIIFPFLVFFWFFVLSILILLMSDLGISQIIMLSAAMIAAIRMLAYYNEEASMEVSKLFPYTLLVIFIITPGFFSLSRILGNLSNVTELLGSIVSFGLLLIGLELVLRIIDLATRWKTDLED